jgi:acetamidase/formamidase
VSPAVEPVTAVEPGLDTVTWGHFDGRRAPVASVGQGERFEIASLQAHFDPHVPDEPSAATVRSLRAAGVPIGPGPHIVTGPVEIRGVSDGDAVAVDLHRIEVDAHHGINRMAPGAGLLSDFPAAEDMAVLPLDPAGATALLPPGVRVPLRPFFGIIATGPPADWGVLDTVPPRANGGNIDCADLVTGTRLILPAFVDGGMLIVGDGHGAQGDGEVDQTAVETAMRGTLSAEAVSGLALASPVAVTPSHLIAFGFDEDMLVAARRALDALLDLLEVACGLSRRDGYRLASVAVDLRFTQVVNRTRGAHAAMPRTVLDQVGPPAWVTCPGDPTVSEPGGAP